MNIEFDHIGKLFKAIEAAESLGLRWWAENPVQGDVTRRRYQLIIEIHNDELRKHG